METRKQFKGRTLTRTKVCNNITKVWLQCTEEDKFDWYKEANKFAEMLTFDVSLDNINGSFIGDKMKVCGIIAALSPVKTWSQNKLLAEDLWRNGDCKHMNLFKNKALAIKNLTNPTPEAICEILKGNKITSFFLNIWLPDAVTEVTIDRHALCIALNTYLTEEEMKGITKGQYNFFRDCYIRTADKLEIKPLLLQSATWVKWRKLKKQK